MRFRLIEDYLLEYNQKQIQDFIDKYGKESWNDFERYNRSLSKVKDINGESTSTDITYHLKNTSVGDMRNILKRAKNKEFDYGTDNLLGLDIEGRPIPKPANTKKLLYNENGNKVYFVTDYTDMIELSAGTGDGSVGGMKTGWCVGGRYDVPFGQVKVSQAFEYFYKCINKYHLDDKGYYVLITPETKFCIMMSGNEIFNITDIDDNDHGHYGEDGSSRYIDSFLEDYSFMKIVLGIKKDWSKEIFYWDGKSVAPKDVIKVVIKDSVTYISKGAFFSCRHLISISIPDSVTKIGRYAFDGCESLQSITIPDSVTYIGYNAFSFCTSLQSITISESVTKIDSEAFKGCESLQSIIIPDSVTKIGRGAFNNCESLQSITLPEKFGDELQSIGIDSNRTKVIFI